MNFRASILLGALLALGVVACDTDPYEDVQGGAPAVVSVVATGLVDDTLTPVEDSDGADGWAVVADDLAQSVVHVRANKLLDPTTVQTSVTDCTPANSWLTVAGPVADCTGTPATWFSCYSPASAAQGFGASIVLFQACEDPAELGWYGVAEPLAPGATYTFSGAVADQGGTALPISVTLTAPAAPAP